ncbi:MAG: hypothetical protein PHP23_01740 [Desulfobacterales bacterium]|nr:hypothetical protein [Desulfobacterales bacterium]MDD4071378.1 hypothetical protein [Desulfobacterales bacterium]MDD4391423.1 hypothetical protein [Desulfobacterales bacterium]
MTNPDSISTLRKDSTIVLPFDQDYYPEIVADSVAFRAELDHFIDLYPELFPSQIKAGYRMKAERYSKRLSLCIRRIEITGSYYSARPGFIMPYMTAITEKFEKALFLPKFDVSFWAIAYVFGKDVMHWYRLENCLGRNKKNHRRGEESGKKKDI